jgi:hypothetical protein
MTGIHHFFATVELLYTEHNHAMASSYSASSKEQGTP